MGQYRQDALEDGTPWLRCAAEPVVAYGEELEYDRRQSVVAFESLELLWAEPLLDCEKYILGGKSSNMTAAILFSRWRR